jgi:hypothetical protein
MSKHTTISKKRISEGLRVAYASGSRIKKSPMQGRQHSPETKNKMRLAALKRIKRQPETIPDHTGHIKENAKYEAIHAWVNKYFEEKESCENCGSLDYLDWSNKDGEYTRERDDWQVLCRSCHMKYDRRYNIWKPEGWKR